jgi:spermidine/putrescine transport system permease protein
MLFVCGIYLFIYLPLVVLIVNSFNGSPLASKWEGFTTNWYYELFQSPEIAQAVANSLIIALSSTALSIVLGAAFVIGTVRKKIYFADALFYPNIFTPDIVLALSVLSLFKFLGLTCGFTSLIVGHTAIGLVFVIPIIRTRMQEIDARLIEASLDLGANYLYTTQKIILPLLTPALITAAFMAFTISLDDFFISFFCAGNEIETLSLYIFSHQRTQSSPVLSALSASMILASMLLLLSLFVIQRKLNETTENARK